MALVATSLLFSGAAATDAAKRIRPLPQSVTVTSPTGLSGQPTAQPERKLIEFGWDTPSVSYLHDHLGEMQSLPFDGVTFKLTADKTPRLKALDPSPWTEEQMQFPLLEDLPSRYGRLDDSFIQLNGPPEYTRMNWFDDSQWSRIEANMQLFSLALSISGARGVLFDPEFYGAPGVDPWEFHPLQNPGKSFSEAAAKARERGRQFITALQSHAPDMTFLSLFFPSFQYQRSPVSIHSAPEKAPEPLMFFFNQGIVEGAAASVELVDGHEWSYYNRSTSAFIEDHVAMRATSEWFPAESHDEWEGVQIGPGIYMDHALGKDPAAPPTALNEAEQLAWLQHNVYWALQSSDQYAWFYSERMNWYEDPSEPAGVHDAVARARDLVATGQPLGYDMSITGEGTDQRAEIWHGALPLKLREPSSDRPGPRRAGRRLATVRRRVATARRRVASAPRDRRAVERRRFAVERRRRAKARSRLATARRRHELLKDAFSLRTPATDLSSASLIVDGLPVATDFKEPFWFALEELSPGTHTAIVRAELPGGGTVSSAARTFTVS